MSLPMQIKRGACALLLTSALALPGQAAEQVFKFADTNSPGKVVIQMGLGDVRVVGADIADVRVTSDENFSGDNEPRSDGLRRLDSGSSHAVASEGNVVTITAGNLFGGRNGQSTDLVVTVPVAAGVTIQRTGPGETSLEKLSGDVEIHAAIGDIELESLSGGAVVETVNGDVHAVFTNLVNDRPVSISAVRGDVELFVPASAKADVRFRTLHGEVLTDFGDELKTNTKDEWSEEGTASVEDERARAEQEREAAREAERQAREDAKRAREEAKRAAAQANGRRGSGPGVTMPPMPAMPPMPPMHIPAMAGGRVVAGTLNDGGTDISITTLNGDIRFRKNP